MEEDAHEPGEEPSSRRPTYEAGTRPLGKGLRPTSPRPETDQATESPEVDEEDHRIRWAPDRWYQEDIDHIVLPTDQPTDDDPDEECRYHLPRHEDQDQGTHRGQEAPEPNVLALCRWRACPKEGQEE